MSAPPNQNKPSLHTTVAHPSDDGDDEDLDDLDEVLDQFSPAPVTGAVSTPAPKSATLTSASASIPRAPPPTATLDAYDSDEPEGEDELASAFTRELQREMESLMREMVAPDSSASKQQAEGAGGTSQSPKDLTQEQERVFKAAWEAMLVQELGGQSGGEEFHPSSSSSSLRKDGKKEGKDVGDGEGDGRPGFQSGIRAAMDKLKSSESGFKSSPSISSTSPPGETPSDPLAAFLSQLNDLSGGEDGGDAAEEQDEEELRGMLELMMDGLMSKEVLYEPLKELGEKYPSYLQANAATLSAADKSRYEVQLGYITRIIGIFEDPGYTEDEKAKVREVVELMGLMQTCGSPPTELMGDLPPGFTLNADGMPAMPEGCCIS